MAIEKVKIASAIERASNGTPILSITLADGRVGGSYDMILKEKLNVEIELDVKLGKEYQGVQQYYFNLPKENKGGGGFPKKDYAFEKKRVALECASRIYQSTNNNAQSVIDLAKSFHTYLNS